MSVWPDGYYVSYNLFGPSAFGGEACAFDRANMLLGQLATQQCFQPNPIEFGLLPADLDGSTPPPVGSPNYFVALGNAANRLDVWKFHVDWTTSANSTFTGPTSLTTAPFTEVCLGATRRACIPQLNTSQSLEALSDRLMYRLAYRNFGDHEAMVVNHAIVANGGSGLRWYEIRIASGIPSLYQQGTYAPDSNYRWMGSIAMNHTGAMGLGFSLSGTTLNPAIHYTGRLAADPLGQMTIAEETILDGTGSQTSPTRALARWGDYSAMRIDPSDDCTFWYTTEYIINYGIFNWSTRIGSFKLADFQISAPANVTAGIPFNVIVTALDSCNAAYSGTVHFTSSDPKAVLPADSTLASNTGTFPVTLKTAGLQTIIATDTVTSTIRGSVTVMVGNAPAAKFSLNLPPTATVNTAFTADYTATVHFTTSDPSGSVVLPADYTFQSADQGQTSFSTFKLQTPGVQSITATDTINNSITGTGSTTVTTDGFLRPQGRTVRLFRGNVVVASFTDDDTNEIGNNLSAVIDWGDGTAATPGIVVRVGTTNVFNVAGSHSYAKKTTYKIKVTMTDSGGSISYANSTARFLPRSLSY